MEPILPLLPKPGNIFQMSKIFSTQKIYKNFRPKKNLRNFNYFSLLSGRLPISMSVEDIFYVLEDHTPGNNYNFFMGEGDF